jgi:hypothetical protein
VPWAPELFSAPALQGVLEKYRRDRLRSVPFFDGLVTGEIDALIESFSRVPEVHHPVRGRIRGERAFRRFVADMTRLGAQRDGREAGIAVYARGDSGRLASARVYDTQTRR